MRTRAILGIVLGALVFASGFAHAFLGWPPLGEALAQAGLDSDTSRALRVGWNFGSAAMFAFGLIVAGNGMALLRGGDPPAAPVWIVAAAFFFFGLGAFLRASRSAHFVAFMVIGVLAGLFAWRRRRS